MTEQLIIFFEGADKSGKSTIANHLSKTLNIPYFKNTTEKKFFHDNEIAKYRWLDQLYLFEFLKQTKYSVIIDRGFISDLVYTFVFRDENKHSIDMLNDIDRMFAKINAKIIYCYKDYNRHLDDVIDLNANFQKLKCTYERVLKNSKCDYFKLNTTDENLDREIGEILKWITHK